MKVTEETRCATFVRIIRGYWSRFSVKFGVSSGTVSFKVFVLYFCMYICISFFWCSFVTLF